MKHEQFYVYTLAYPDGKVFYIGKGCGKRIDVHERYVRTNNTQKSKNPHKDRVIRNLLAAGLDVRKEKIALFDSEEEALLYEYYLINEVYGVENLTNLTHGGDGHSTVRPAERPKRTCEEELFLDEVAKYLQLSTRTVFRLIKRGRLQAEKIDGCWRFKESNVYDYGVALGKFLPRRLISR